VDVFETKLIFGTTVFTTSAAEEILIYAHNI
jgi:hypothetical protein